MSDLVKVTARQENSDDCFVCGVHNKLGFRSMFYETEKEEVICLADSRFEYQSYPERLHGGISTTLLDETMGRAILIKNPDTFGVTIDMTTKFLKPVPLGQTLRIIGKITQDRRIFIAEGRILLEDGTIAVTATARYLKMPIPKIAESLSSGENIMYMVDAEKEIAEISDSGPLQIIYKD